MLNAYLLAVDLTTLTISGVMVFISYRMRKRNEKLASKFSSRLTEERSLGFLTYLTAILSSGQTVQMLDELMKYYTTARVQEAERGADTVNVVLKRLETVIWELAQLLEKATRIEKVRGMDEKVRSDSRLSYILSFLLLPESCVIILASFLDGGLNRLDFFLATFAFTIFLALAFLVRSHLTINRMAKEAISKSQGRNF